MPATQRYQVNVFAIIALIILVIVLVYLIIAAVYFFNLMNLKPPTQSESTFLFATAVILSLILFFITIYALWEIFAYSAFIYETPQPVVQYVVAPPAPAPAPTPTPVMIQHTPEAHMYVAPVAPTVAPVTTYRPYPYNATLSQPATVQLNPLQQEIASFGRAVSQ